MFRKDALQNQESGIGREEAGGRRPVSARTDASQRERVMVQMERRPCLSARLQDRKGRLGPGFTLKVSKAMAGFRPE